MENETLYTVLMWLGGIAIYLIGLVIPRTVIAVSFGFILTQYFGWSPYSWILWAFLALLGLCIDCGMHKEDDDDKDDEIIDQMG